MTTSIVEVIQKLEVEQKMHERRRDRANAEITHILNKTSEEARSNFTADEDARIEELRKERASAKADADAVAKKLEEARATKAEQDDIEKSYEVRTETGAKRPAYDQVARVGNEARTYNKDVDKRGGGFLRDIVMQSLYNDAEAGFRLSRHMQEERVERSQYLERAVGTSAFAGLVVPQYLTDQYAPAVANLRPFADVCNKHALPSSGMTVNISRITTATGVALQASQNSGVQETNADDTLLTIDVLTAAGQQTVSRQAVERGTGVEEVVLQDLFKRYATKLDETLLNQSTTGLTNVAQNVSYTDTTPTAEEAYPKILNATANVEAALLGQARPTHAVMHSRRWYWLQSQLSDKHPLIGQPGINALNVGQNNALGYNGGIRGILPNGLGVVVDNNVATNLGSGTNEDEIYVVAQDECHLWEDPSAPVFIRAEQTNAASLGVLLVVYGYFAYTFGRYTNGSGKVSGTGLVTPAF